MFRLRKAAIIMAYVTKNVKIKDLGNRFYNHMYVYNYVFLFTFSDIYGLIMAYLHSRNM
jgi:hypothetical protein